MATLSITSSKSFSMTPPPATKHEGLHAEILLWSSVGPIFAGAGTNVAPEGTHKWNIYPEHATLFNSKLKEKVKAKSAYELSVSSGRSLSAGFWRMKRLGVFLLPLRWDAGYRRVTPSIKFAGIRLYTWVERGTERVKCLARPRNTMQCSQLGLEPWPLDPETSALTMTPQRLHLNRAKTVSTKLPGALYVFPLIRICMHSMLT